MRCVLAYTLFSWRIASHSTECQKGLGFFHPILMPFQYNGNCDYFRVKKLDERFWAFRTLRIYGNNVGED